MNVATDEILDEIRKVVRKTRTLVELSTLPLDATTSAVFIATWVLVGKSHGLSREQLHKVIDDIWTLDSESGG